jgi:DNA-binding response OmpR family regulator
MGAKSGLPHAGWMKRVRRARILVIDDDPQIREMLRNLFTIAKYEVLVAPDGDEALKLHRANPADLIVTDIVMPEKEGLETILEFRRHFPAVRIIAISGGGKIGPHDYLNTAKAMGAQKTFAKPFSLRELLAAVREVLQNDPEPA